MSIESVSGIVAGAAALQSASRANVARTLSRHTISAPGTQQPGEVAGLDGRSLETHDRDADGRLAWQFRGTEVAGMPCNSAPDPPVPSDDTPQDRATTLDLTG